MTEELKIKLSVDTSSVQSTINKLKNEASNVNKALNNSSTSKSTEAAAQSSKRLSEAMGKVEQSVAQIKQGISGWDLVKAKVGIDVISKTFDKAKKDVTELKNKLLGTFDGHLANTIESALKLDFKSAKINFGEFTDSIKAKIGTVKENIAGIGKAFKSGGVKEGFAAMGTSAKGAATAIGGSLKGALTAVAGALASVATAAGAVVLALAAVVTVAGVAASFSVSKLGSEVYHSAQQFGFSAKAFQEWGYIMERNGSTIEDLRGFLETLASEQAAVAEGSEDAAANFERLGLSANAVLGMDQQKLFEETVARIQNIGNATERSAIAYSIFGDEASRLMNVLNMNNAEMQEMINNYQLLGGGMSNTLIEQSNGLQSSISNLKQAWQGISNTLAEAFIPVVRAIVDWLTKALVVVNLFLRVIFGLDLNTKKASSSMNSGIAANKAYANSAKAATKSVEQLKRVTMGFDELNIVQDPNKSAGSGAGGGSAATPNIGGGLGNMEDLMPDMSALNLDAIYAWFEEYKGVIAQITTWSLLLIGIILAVIGCMTVNIPMAIVGFGMAGLGIAIGMKSGAFAAMWEGIKKIATAAGEWIAGWTKKLGETFSALGQWINEKFIQPTVEFFKKLWDKIVEIFTPVVEWFTKLFTSVGNSIKSIIDVIVGLFKGGWLLIQTVWGVVSGWFNEKIIQPISGFFSGMWNGIKGAASSAWEGIKSVFSPVVSWFKEKFSAAWTAVKNVFSIGGKIFDGIKDGIANVFKTVVNGIIGGINKVIAVPFNAINSLLNKIRNVSVAGIEPFKSFIKYNALSVPQIPKLATGGIVTRETLATIGEGGKREAVLPLEQNTGWMDALADKIAERNGAPSKIVLNIDGKEFAWAAINGINNITRQTGGIQLALI